MDNENKSALIAIGTLLILAALFAIQIGVPVSRTDTFPQEIPLKYIIREDPTQSGFDGFNSITYANIHITNEDSYPGVWKINCHFKTLTRTFHSTIDIRAYPFEEKRESCKADTRFGEDVIFSYYVAEVPTKQVMVTREIIDSKNVPLIFWLIGIR